MRGAKQYNVSAAARYAENCKNRLTVSDWAKKENDKKRS